MITEQLELDLALQPQDEAFITGYKQGWKEANTCRTLGAPLVDMVFDALHKFQTSVRKSGPSAKLDR